MKEVFPIAARGDENDTEEITDSDGNTTTEPVYMSIHTTGIVALLTKAMQELSAKVEEQAKRIEELEK